MTVKELKEYLKNYPDDSDIYIRKPDGIWVVMDFMGSSSHIVLLSNCEVEKFDFNSKIGKENE